MKPTHPPPGKMLVHGRQAGEVTDVDIKRRANELASIEQRSPSKADVAQAKRELRGDELPPGVNEDERPSHIAITRDPSEPPSDTGEQVPDREGDDEQQITERLVEDGVDEAQHDQMLAARRTSKRGDRNS